MSAGDNPSSSKKSSEEVAATSPTTKKYTIIVELNGVKGKDAAKWSSRCGHLIRSYIPIGFAGWKQVDDYYKDELWKALMKEFDITNITPKDARIILEKGFPRFFRTFKMKMRKKLVNEDGLSLPRRVALDNRPDNIDKIWWTKFFDIKSSKEKRMQCKTNSQNKANNPITHTLGRKPYTKLYDEMKAKFPDEKIARAMTWKLAHESKKTGAMIPCVAEKYGEIVAAEEKRKESAGDNDIDDFDGDVISEVFGTDNNKRSYCRASSSTSTVKQIQLKKATQAICETKASEDIHQLKADMECKFDTLEEKLNANMQNMEQNIQQTLVQTLQQFMSQFTPNPIPSFMTPIAEVGSNPSNKARESTTAEDKRSVILLSEDLKEVAKGSTETRKICHGRKVLEGEQVVWVDDVYDPEASIYKAPQDGNHKLADIVGGAYLIWLVERLRDV